LGGFSGGMLQRVGIAQALIGNPQLLIVDEPTAGLDPEERARLHNLLAESTGEKTVVLLSTHIVSDVSNLCNRFAVIRGGRILTATSPEAALATLEGHIWEATLPREQVAGLKATGKVISAQMAGRNTRVRMLSKNGKPAEPFVAVTATLEDYYFVVVNQV
jgi:ABC-type multidrug transport system ATPase subunit